VVAAPKFALFRRDLPRDLERFLLALALARDRVAHHKRGAHVADAPRHSDEMVDIVAERVGYADATHFIRMFRREQRAAPAARRAAQAGSFELC
jgi:transcriptional regulator GlxA family with amidase domain